jgi:DNA-binding NtrC family response regulator
MFEPIAVHRDLWRTRHEAKGEMAKTVLIVDDDELVRDLLWRNLNELGFEVADAESGAKALQCLADKEFDLVILDYAMPGMSGPATAQEIRRSRPGQRLLLISGYAGTGVLRTEHGDIPLLGKPFMLDQLEAAVEGALAA